MRLPPLLLALLVSLLLVNRLTPVVSARQPETPPNSAHDPFARDRIVAWCIVPFDSQRRSPTQRAEMLNRLGLQRLAYDYRQEHIASFDDELDQLTKHHIELTAWWFPSVWNDEARLILDTLKRHQIRTQLWVTGEGEPTRSDEEQQARIASEVNRIRPLAQAAADQGCSIGLYNHGGWFGEPENQIAIIKALAMPNVGIVYNLHHAHPHLDRFESLLRLMKPYLMMLNLNGTVPNGDNLGKKIVPIGAGELDAQMFEIIQRVGYRGSIGILNHTQLDAELRLLDNLDGLDWVLQRLHGNRDLAPPTYRTWDEPAIFNPPPAPLQPDESKKLSMLLEATQHGQAATGAKLFASAKSACLSCHRIGERGGKIGPDLSEIGKLRSATELAESLLWPNRHVEPKYQVTQIATSEEQILRGYVSREDPESITLLDPTLATEITLNKSDIENRAVGPSLMPDGLLNSMSTSQQADLLTFLSDLGHHQKFRKEFIDSVLKNAQSHDPSGFPWERKPLIESDWPNWEAYVNRDRVYDFYTKQAVHFKNLENPPDLLSESPELDSGKYGHWGNQNEKTWANDDWNQSNLGTVLAGVFHGPDRQVITRSICVQLGNQQQVSACVNTDTLNIEALWQGGFLEFSSVRHGFLDGLRPKGKALPLPPTATLARHDKREYRGFYRFGKRIAFVYLQDGEEIWDAPWYEDGKLVRQIAPKSLHPLRTQITKPVPQWPQTLETAIQFGQHQPYAVDTIELPTENPWKALFSCGDHDFFPDGSALLCTMQGDVWKVSGIAIDDPSHPPTTATATWRRFASGLHQPLGLKICDDGIFVLGRDQITRLHDDNQDGEADFYECFSKAFASSAAGHDYVCGLHRDQNGQFFTASSNQGLVRISADGKSATTLAEGFRNPDGVGLYPDHVATVPCSEGDWTPASMICAVRTDSTEAQNPLPFYGHRSSRFSGTPIIQPQLPMVYLPRLVDNSAGGQVYVDSDRWGPLRHQMIHTSFGTGSHLLLLRDEVEGVLQGAVVPLVGEFLSGAHRGRFSPRDGQLYVTGMGGWGTYTPRNGCFQRVRYTGQPVQLPVGIHAHRNGIALKFSQSLDPTIASQVSSHFAQAWNYRYSAAYGSAEYSTLHYGARGHDRLRIRSSHLLDDERTLFIEIADLQPVEQLHLHVTVAAGQSIDLFATCHRLDQDRTDFPGYQPSTHQRLPHPIEFDMKMVVQRVPNPWSKPLPEARSIRVVAGKNLNFETPKIIVKANESIALTLVNPDVVPHNWALIKPGTLQAIGEEANKLVADPEALIRQYVPQTDDVICYTDIVEPGQETSIYFQAPQRPGTYPFLCTFPGHWMVMNGQLIVEK